MLNTATPTCVAGFRCLEFASAGQPSAAIVWLHGRGERGHELSDVLRFGLPAALAADRAITNASVFCPQLEPELEWPADRVQALIAEVKARHKHVALLGYSLGGLGVCNVLSHYGAVADLHIAICGRAADVLVIKQTGTRFLAISGELDPRPSIAHFVSSVVDLGGEADEIILKGHGHFISEAALEEPRVKQALANTHINLAVRSHSEIDPLGY